MTGSTERVRSGALALRSRSTQPATVAERVNDNDRGRVTRGDPLLVECDLEQSVATIRCSSGAAIWKDAAPPHLVDVAVFCDSDDTHTASISYFAYVRLERR